MGERMSTTNTDYEYYYYIRKKGTRYYIGVVNNNGAAIGTSNLDIEIFYDEFPDEITDNDTLLPIPTQFELGFIKGIAAELMAMSSSDTLDVHLKNQYIVEYQDCIRDAINYQIKESQQPAVINPFDLRED